MIKLLIFTLVGIGAQIVDGTLGMAFGVTATTLLVLSGTGAAHASAAVHFAEVATTLASGASHWRFGNIDWKVVLRLGVPGGVGAFLGATVLSRISTESAAPITAGILLAIGVFLVVRFSSRPPVEFAASEKTAHSAKFLTPLGLFGGFIDASGGGGWGPVTTSTLLTTGRSAPRTVIGSVSASEFIVSASASVGFLLGLGSDFFDNLVIIAGLALGGVIAAPLAAWLVSRITPGVLGTGVGGLLVLTNARSLFKYFDIEGAPRTIGYVLIVVVAVGLTVLAWRKSRAATAAEPAAAPTATTGPDAAGTEPESAGEGSADATQVPVG
ncbi:sulfite exporter TauE/SafE family protein [Nocardia sp. NBC_01329]|uniref:sulfite exporter TauE/SafE family protein n=1 Tax=Nocardia sp. NBC_01329 TaxID=2903594 RepID=UPI002E151C07|nr:sulfite exporter TauE/SafE family protein [Nocardia sp. NBC_01329]